MKTLNKEEFVKFLKIISITLDKAKIKHEIPFCHIDKQEWKNITIIIPDIITDFDLIKILNITESTVKNAIMYTKMDDFDVRFIKASDKLWSYTHYYYSWDILNILMHVLAKKYSMSYDRTGLYYKYADRKILITTNLQDIFEFFDLPFHLITNGFATDYVIFSFIEAATYFDSESFTLDNFKKIDYYYENNKQYYINFIDHKPNLFVNEIPHEEQIGTIDAFFPKANFFEKLTRIELKSEFPNLKEKKIKPNIDVLLNKEKQIKEFKKKRKINLSKYFKKKDNPGNDDFNISN